MRFLLTLCLLLLATAAGLAGGYRIGTGAWPDKAELVRVADFAADLTADFTGSDWVKDLVVAEPTGRTVLYWKDPDGAPRWSPALSKTADGRDFLPVYDEEEPEFAENLAGISGAGDQAAAPSDRKLLYYRNPMGLPDTSPVPKKDWMGMDYIPVYEGEELDDGSTFKVSLDRVQRAGVRSTPAEMQKLSRPVRATGKVTLDESRLRIVTLRFDGFVEKLYANTTGQRVRAGEPLFRVFSQEVRIALARYRAGTQSAGDTAKRDAEGARQRLANLEVPPEHIRRSKDAGTVPEAIEWPSPVSGTIMEKMVIEGERAEAGRSLFKIADLSHVWVMAEIAEQDLGLVREGAEATLTLRAMPGQTITGKISFVYPGIDPATRTGKVRIALANPDGHLKPEMFADVVIDAGTGDAPRLTVPVDAVISSGDRQVVIIDKGEGSFEPRAVKLGLRGNDRVEILEGIAAGDRVVVTANFLIDAESNLRAALKSLAPDAPAPGTERPATPTAAKFDAAVAAEAKP